MTHGRSWSVGHLTAHRAVAATGGHSAAPQPPPYWPRSQPPTQPAAHDAAGARGWASGRRSSASCSEMNTQNSFGTLTNASISCNERRTMRHVAADATRGSRRDTWRRTRHLAADATRRHVARRAGPARAARTAVGASPVRAAKPSQARLPPPCVARREPSQERAAPQDAMRCGELSWRIRRCGGALRRRGRRWKRGT